MKKLLSIIAAALLLASPAEAASSSFLGTLPTTGNTAAFAGWCVGGTGANCSGGVFWPSTVIANSSGTELFTSANPGLVDETTGSQFHTDLTAPTPCQTATAWNTNAAYGSGVTEATLCDLQAAFWQDLGAVAGVQLGAPSNFGTTPGAVKVPGVNASVFGNDPCLGQAKTNLAINQNGTTSAQLIALSGSTKVYVCSLFLLAAGATTLAITTGTGTACASSNTAVIGTTTANIANSVSLAANGGLTLGNGEGTIGAGAASSELCMILGSNVYVSGNLTYVQQ